VGSPTSGWAADRLNLGRRTPTDDLETDVLGGLLKKSVGELTLLAAKWPHNCCTYGVARAAETADSTALGLRSMVRMGPALRSARSGSGQWPEWRAAGLVSRRSGLVGSWVVLPSATIRAALLDLGAVPAVPWWLLNATKPPGRPSRARYGAARACAARPRAAAWRSWRSPGQVGVPARPPAPAAWRSGGPARRWPRAARR
jgi:hypothetical protein